MMVWDCSLYQEGNSHAIYPEAHPESAVALPCFRKNADDAAIASVTALYVASAAAYAEKTRLKTKA